MLRANAATGNLSILLPMVTGIDEVDAASDRTRRARVEEMIGYAIETAYRRMLEVPSMVFMPCRIG